MRLERRFPLKGLTDIRVIDCADDEPIGYIGDISSGGFRVISEDPLAPDTQLQINLEIPVRANHHRTLSLNVQCKWSRRDARLKRFNLGFKLNEPSEAFQELLTEIRTALKLKRRTPV